MSFLVAKSVTSCICGQEQGTTSLAKSFLIFAIVELHGEFLAEASIGGPGKT
jgi:hypothetical protein